MPLSSGFRRSQRRRPKGRYEHGEHAEQGERFELVPSRRPRRRRRLVVLIVIGLALVWSAPIVVSHTPALGWVLGWLASDLEGTATVESASLGWFSRPVVTGLKVHDRQGQIVLDLPAATADRSLLGLLGNRAELGTLRLEKPTLRVELRPDGSNVEDVIANYLARPSGKPFSLAVEIADGTVQVSDSSGGKPWTIQQFRLSFSRSAEAPRPISLSASGVLPETGEPGQVDVELKMDQSNRVTVKAKGLALERLTGLVGRLVPQTQLAGRMTGQLECQWGGDGSAGTLVKTDAAIRNLDLATPPLGTDRVRLAELKAVGGFTWRDGRLAVERTNVQCDLGRAELAGSLPVGSGGSGGLDGLLHETFQLSGQIDLARLAALMPRLLHIHEQTQVTAGTLSLELTSRREGQGMVWQGRLETSDLTAMRRGRQLVWQQPILLALDARETPEGPEIKSLRCESQFLRANVAGRRQDLVASLEFDLDRLAERLDGFADLAGTRMAGGGWANLHWSRDPKNVFKLDADARIGNLAIEVPGRQGWREESLDVVISATGQTTFGADTRVDTAEVDLRAGAERLVVRLRQPVATFAAASSWPLAVDARGDLARWTTRAKAWNLLETWDAAGTCQAEGEAVVSLSGVDVSRFEARAEPLRLTGPGVRLDEPAASVSLSGQYQRALRRALVRKAKLDSPTLALEAQSAIVGMPAEKPVELAGQLTFRGDLARLRQAMQTPEAASAWNVTGQLRGEARLEQVGGATSGWLDATVVNLEARSASGKRFAEPSARLVARGTYDRGGNLVKLDEVKLTTEAISGNARGQIAAGADPVEVDLAGQLEYDMERLSARLQSYLGSGVYVAGRGSRGISLAGPLDPARARGAAGFNWSGAFLYGFRVGPGEVKLALAGGVLRAEPLDLAVSEGRVRMAPRVRLAPAPSQFELDPGPLAQNVRIDPQMCAYGLQYIAPVLAGVASAEGTFSIELDECVLPLDNPAAGHLVGRFTVHSIEVGPGPLVRELAILLSNAAPAKLTRESVIQFRMVNGRVYHQGLELVFPELTIRTQGSVGLDQTLNMVAEMPIPPKWTAGNRTLADALRNQIIQVPLGGTLSQPRIDQRRLDQYNQQFNRRAAGNLLEGELNRQLDRLLTPPRK